jgi:hypothetical protein
LTTDISVVFVSFEKNNNMKKLMCLTGLVFLLYACGSNEMGESQKKMLVYNYAIDNIKERIKDPNSIEIPSITERANHVTKIGSSDTYEIDSWFRSRNSFGGMVENSFSCEVTISSDGNTISGRSLKIK